MAKEKQLGGGKRNKLGEALYLAPRLSDLNIFADRREHKKLWHGELGVFILSHFGTARCRSRWMNVY
jgi:hypothetical protein